MEEIFVQQLLWSFELFGQQITINLSMVIMTWIVMALIIIASFLGTRSLKEIPGKFQSILEFFIESFNDLVISTLGEEKKHYIPLIATIFIFVLISNWIGIIPHLFAFFGIIIGLILKVFGLTAAEIVYNNPVNIQFIPPANEWYSFFFRLPAFSEPTRYLSTDLGLGILVAIVVHSAAVKEKGFGGYLKSYAEPVWVFAPLNLISEIAKVISHSFRLFGNILGGSIIIVIVSKLVLYLGLPVVLQIFFGLFVGAIQAFVFAMLAVTYIAVQIK